MKTNFIRPIADCQQKRIFSGEFRQLQGAEAIARQRSTAAENFLKISTSDPHQQSTTQNCCPGANVTPY
jgi:hypothetical protein